MATPKPNAITPTAQLVCRDGNWFRVCVLPDGRVVFKWEGLTSRARKAGQEPPEQLIVIPEDIE